MALRQPVISAGSLIVGELASAEASGRSCGRPRGCEGVGYRPTLGWDSGGGECFAERGSTGQCRPAAAQGAVQRLQLPSDAGRAGGLGRGGAAQTEVGCALWVRFGCCQHGVGEFGELVPQVTVQVFRCRRDLPFQDRDRGFGLAAGPVAAGRLLLQNIQVVVVQVDGAVASTSPG